MATHSSILAWRIPGTKEPGRLPSVGLHRVGHDRSDLAAANYEGFDRHLPTETLHLSNTSRGETARTRTPLC